MAKAKESSSNTVTDKPAIKRPGRHSKKKSSKNKISTHYKKPYRGQGK